MVETITVKYKGKELALPIRIKYLALKKFQQETGKSIEQVSREMDVASFDALFYWGIQAGCKVEGIACPIEREEAEDVLDLCFDEFKEVIVKFFPKVEEPIEKN